MEDYLDVQVSIENEGIGYFLTSYCSSDDMPDEKGKELFDKAIKAIEEFEKYVQIEADKCKNF